MKRHVVIGILLAVLICLFCLLNGDIVDSTDYTGTWYRSSDGAQYIFENGIIRCGDYGLPLEDDSEFSGAYSYGRDRIVLFVADRNGVGEVLELKRIPKWTGDILCEYRDGYQQVIFCRNHKNAHQS